MLATFNLVSANNFTLGAANILSLGKELKSNFKFNSLPSDKLLDGSKLKTLGLADDTINITSKQKFFLGWVENISGKGENSGNQHFLLFSQCFQKASFFRIAKSQDCVVQNYGSNLTFCWKKGFGLANCKLCYFQI